jgi:hypothetical protein
MRNAREYAIAAEDAARIVVCVLPTQPAQWQKTRIQIFAIAL